MNATAKIAPVLPLDFGARSDVGRVRENNEDNFRVAAELGLFILSDGMGGLEAGELASRLAVETVFGYCRDAESGAPLAFEGEAVAGASETSNHLASAIQLANRVIHAAAGDSAASSVQGAASGSSGAVGGMGATIVALQFFGERVSVAHCGDSRAYRLRGGELVQLTDDHSLVAQQVREGRMTEAEAEASPLKNVLVRALGIEAAVDVEVDEELVLDGDVYLLCSDGLTRELSDRQIAGLLAETPDAQRAANRLIDLANQAGGGDNITAIVVRVSARHEGPLGKIGRWIKGSGNS